MRKASLGNTLVHEYIYRKLAAAANPSQEQLASPALYKTFNKPIRGFLKVFSNIFFIKRGRDSLYRGSQNPFNQSFHKANLLKILPIVSKLLTVNKNQNRKSA